MISSRFVRLSPVLLTVFAILLTSCPNPLLSTIEESVQEVVTPPEAKASYPVDKALDIPVNIEVITVTFSKPINPSSVTSGSFFVKDPEGTTVSGTRVISNDTIQFTPNAALAYSTTYTVTATVKIIDTDGNPLPEEIIWSFTTGPAPDTAPPEDISVTIESGTGDVEWTNSTTVTVYITAADNREITQMNVTDSGASSFTDSGWTTFQPEFEWELPAGDGVKSLWIKLKDGAGNVSGEVGTDSIQLDTTPPVIEFVRVNGGIAATMETSYDFDIRANDDGGSGTVGFSYRTGDEATEIFSAWSDSSPLTEGEATVSDVAIGVPEGGSELVEVRVTDVAGNVSAATRESIRFDQTAPVILEKNFADYNPASPEYFPFDGAIISVTFDEEMDGSTFDELSFDIAAVSGSVLTKLEIFAINVQDTTVLVNGDAVTYADRVAEISGFEVEPNSEYAVTLSGTVTDLAGNPLSVDYAWNFVTGDSTDNEPPEIYNATLTVAEPDVAAVLPNGVWATTTQLVTINIVADDRYNEIFGMKFWGDTSVPATYPAFEQDASWEPYDSAAPEKVWNLSNGYGVKYVLFKLIDQPQNESANPYPVKILYDATAPVIDNFQANDGAEYTNDSNGYVDLTISASDDLAGIKEMWVSTTSDTVEPGTGIIYQDEVSSWRLPDADDEYTIYLQISDYLDQIAGSSTSIILDREPPEIQIYSALIATNGDYAISHGGDPLLDNIQIADVVPLSGVYSDLADVTWETGSGPVDLDFSFGDGDPFHLSPTIHTETDGEYIISVVAEDNAGNIAVEPVTFIWDTQDPADTLALSAQSPVNTRLPSWSWEPVAGADFYRCSFDPGFAEPYYDEYSTSFTATEDRPEGPNTLYVKAMDIAGNEAAPEFLEVIVDLTAPVVDNSGGVYITNTAQIIDVNGRITETGGDVTYLWEVDGPGTFDISDAASAAPVFTPDETAPDGEYTVTLNVTDLAGNIGQAFYTIFLDTEKPSPPVISGPANTMNETPTWSWTGDSTDGSGYFNYKLTDTTTGTVIVDWLPGTEGALVGSYTPPGPLNVDAGGEAGIEEFTLSIIERDAAGNWSDPAEFVTLVDTVHVPPPFVSGPDLTNDPRPEWSWVSGTEGSGIDPGLTSFEVQIVTTGEPDPGSWIPVLAGVYTYTPTVDLATGDYTFYVRETYIDSIQTGNKATEVDRDQPLAPALVEPYGLYPAGLETEDPGGRWASYDDTPGWRWESSTSDDAVPSYSYRLMDSGDSEITSGTTSGTSYQHPTALDDDTYTLYVKQLDAAGNWSGESSYRITVDQVFPTFDGVVAEGGAVYTNDTTISTAATYNTGESGQTMQYRLYSSSSSYSYSDWEPAQTSLSIPTYDGDGTRYAYIRLRDEAGNITYRYDSIILDTTPPDATFVINNDDDNTPSKGAYLYISATDNYSSTALISIRQRYPEGSYEGAYQSYATKIFSDFEFSPNAGSKTVFIDVKDDAGNVTTLEDSITLQVPTPFYSSKGVSSSGSMLTYFTQVEIPTGSYGTVYYQVGYTSSAAADPNGGASLSSLGTGYDVNYISGTVPTGQVYWFYARAYNYDSGGWGPWSEKTDGSLGFSSDITIVYDDDEADDVAEAQELKWILTGYYDLDGDPDVSGTQPSWSVTLLPEDYISNTYSLNNRIYGDPVVLMNGISTWTSSKGGPIPSSAIAGKIRNIASTTRGIVSIGAGGAFALDMIEDNWTSWSLPGNGPPTVIGAAESNLMQDSKFVKTRLNLQPDNVWFSPLHYTTVSTTTVTSQALWKFDDLGAHASISLYRPPSSIKELAGDYYGGTNYFPIVRQDRFLYYGFTLLPDFDVGKVLMVNLINRMSGW